MNPEDALEAAERLCEDLRALNAEHESLRLAVDAQSRLIRTSLGRALAFQSKLEEKFVRESLKND